MADSTVDVVTHDVSDIREFLRVVKPDPDQRVSISLSSPRGHVFWELQGSFGGTPSITDMLDQILRSETYRYELAGKPYGPGMYHQLWWNSDERQEKVNVWKHWLLALCRLR